MSFIDVITIITEICIRQSNITVENRGWSKPTNVKHMTRQML